MSKFEKHPDYNHRIRSAKYLLTVVLNATKSTEVYEQHIKELLSTLLWKVTEANGKQNTRYWSKGFEALENKTLGQHEHVTQRKVLITQLLKNPSLVARIEELATACMVTREEHERLNHIDPALTGLERYISAGIDITDRWEE